MKFIDLSYAGEFVVAYYRNNLYGEGIIQMQSQFVQGLFCSGLMLIKRLYLLKEIEQKTFKYFIQTI